MAKLGLVFLCLLIGIMLRALRVFPANASHTLNRFVIYISLPATTLLYVPRFQVGTLEGASPALLLMMAPLVFLGAGLVFFLLGRLLGWDRRTTAALVLTAGLGNTSFVGLAVLEAFYGTGALPLGILVDQATFLMLATCGITVAVMAAGGRPSPAAVAKRVLLFPPFLALVAALALRPFALPEYALTWLERLSVTLVPLALVAVGMELNVAPARLRRELQPLALGLSYKLLLAPLGIWALYASVFGMKGFPLQVTVIEAAAAPMITAGIVAAEYDLRPELAALMVGVGIPLSLLTLLLWSHGLA